MQPPTDTFALDVDPGAQPVGSGMPIALLQVKHEDYRPELWERLRLLSEGGYEVLAQASKFLPKMPGEAEERYKHRLQYACFQPYISEVVGFLVGSLFQQTVTVSPASDAADPTTPGTLPDATFYPEFAQDVDRCGTAFSDFLRERLPDVLMLRRGIVGVDISDTPEGIATRRDEEQAGGARAYLYDVPPECLHNWEIDSLGRIVGATICEHVCAEPTPWGTPAANRYRYKVWRIVGDKAEFSVYETRDLKPGEVLPPDYVVPEIVPWTVTSFSAVPLVFFEVPKALWLGNKAGPIQEKHFRKSSDLDGAMGRSLVEIGFIKQGPEIPEVHGALPSEVQQDPGRGAEIAKQIEARNRGFVVLGSGDEIGYAGPSGKAFELADRQCADLREEIFRTVHAMSLSLANTSATVQRSGESKREDRQAMEIVLSALGSATRKCAMKIYTLVSDARDEDVIWSAHGLDNFDSEDRGDLVAEAAEVGLLSLPSPTFQKLYRSKTALALVPTATPEEKEQIVKEIQENTEAELERAEELAEQMAKNPPGAAEENAEGEGGGESEGGAGEAGEAGEGNVP